MVRKGGFSGFYVEGNGPAADVDTQQRSVRASVGRVLHDVRWRQGLRDSARLAIYGGERIVSDLRSGGRRERRAYPVGIGYALALVVLAQPYGVTQDFENWWNNVAGIAGSTWNDIKNFVHTVVHGAISIVEGGLDLIDYAFTVTTNAISAAASWWWTNVVIPAWDWIQNAATTIGGWIDNAWNWFYAEIIAPALALLNDAINYGISALQWALNEAAQGLSWLETNVIDPAWQWVENAANTVAGWVNGWWDWIWANVVAPLIDDAEYWAHLLASIWDWLVNVAVGVINTVVDAWDWIVWFATHSFDDLVALFSGSGPHDVYETIVQQAAGSHSWLDSIVDALESELN